MAKRANKTRKSKKKKMKW